ncbi:hypothetical protein [Arthrospiribacter ruber]|uniref:DKNYY family protein n=1 Tax=Arthrospiribacter ruber TaxID=2487934 RepID=A0A951MBX4_9BACT|nr:hypothetical protein [Arthrospiribacter ruber]MBW3467142.1 hypothetical protein [Arthrospiribacter ruber]
MKSLFFYFLAFLIYAPSVYSQGDFAYQQPYRENILLDQEIVSGGYYVDPSKNIEGHPYFEYRSFELGQITINGLQYKDVPLLYDIWNDELLTFQPVYKKKILIRADKIDEFQLANKRHFIRVDENPGYIHHRNGIYELLEEGKINLLAKHFKRTKDKRDVSKFSDVFYEKTDYFLRKGDDIEVIRRKKQAREFLDMDKKDFRHAIRGERLSFKSQREDFLKRLVQYINQEKP